MYPAYIRLYPSFIPVNNPMLNITPKNIHQHAFFSISFNNVEAILQNIDINMNIIPTQK
ncbi:hypothetical protein DPMN_077797 [Dreissena polymorpha]|uniref:Uncharacterized protein n=1 Tax=Dreissena polymorpha TaxID=45954 RepID=A0A9D3YPY6_DREPO|nr:hypothetical protein DPMN_077797 [Dreissena polymorpha]